MQKHAFEHLLTANSSTRIKSKDMFMLMALWMEKYPLHPPPKTSTCVRPTGCVLVDSRDRILSLECTRESHAVVRAILSCPDPLGCDIYVSRFPCALCAKVMVQAGIRRIYYFPAKDWEMDWEAVCQKTLINLIIPDSNMSIDGQSHSKQSQQDPLSKTPIREEEERPLSVPPENIRVHPSDSFNSSALTPSSFLQPAYLSPPRFTSGSQSQYGSSPRRYSSPHKQPAPLAVLVNEKRDKNYRSVYRLITNNSIAMSLHIPQWDHSDYQQPSNSHPPSLDIQSNFTKIPPKPPLFGLSQLSSASLKKDTLISNKLSPVQNPLWVLDPQLANMPALSQRWPFILAKFEQTLLGMHTLVSMYNTSSIRKYQLPQPIVSPKISGMAASLLNEDQLSDLLLDSDITGDKTNSTAAASSQSSHPVQTYQELQSHDMDRYRHAIVLAHIAAKRTDDAKVGVGAVILSSDGRYLSVGWNGYPKKAAHLDYPTAGADDLIEDEEELKYDYVLHAEQNALLWRNTAGQFPLPSGTTLISTKMPCDECSPVMADCGISRVVTKKQIPKSADDPARLRGLTYEKMESLFGQDVFVFE